MSKHADTVYCTDDKFRQILLLDEWNVCAIDIGRKNFAVCVNNQDNLTTFIDKHEFTFSNPTELTSQIISYMESIPVTFNVVVVESQYKNATKNQKSQETVETFCNIHKIPYIRRSARNKTSSSQVMDILRDISPDIGTMPDNLKKRSIMFCKLYHEKRTNPIFKKKFDTLKKKDDISDVFLMCLYENAVIKERKRINLKKLNACSTRKLNACTSKKLNACSSSRNPDSNSTEGHNTTKPSKKRKLEDYYTSTISESSSIKRLLCSNKDCDLS